MTSNPPSVPDPRPDRGDPEPLTFPVTTLRVSAWPDPVLDNLGHDPRSGYVERFWLPILGPSCLLLLRRLAAGLEQQPDGFEARCDTLARELGIGFRGGQSSPFWRAVERSSRFMTTQRAGNRLVVRRRLPPLTIRQADRLPDELRDAHRAWAADQLSRPKRPTLAAWSARQLDDGSHRPPAEPHRPGEGDQSELGPAA
jgi:hypothetical protein